MTDPLGVVMPDSDEPGVLVRDKVVEVLRAAMFSGVFKPGKKLTERELIELTGASRTSVREALRRLQAERLVEVSESRGLRVAIPTEEEVRYIYEVREELEPLAIQLFVQRATEEEVQALIEARDIFSDTADGLLRIDSMILAGCRNPILAEILGGLYARIHALRRISGTTPARQTVARREYGKLLDAIARRSPQAASAAARNHVRAARSAALVAVKLLHEEASS